MSNIQELKEDLTIAEVVTICCKGLGSDAPEKCGNGVLRFSTICHNQPHTGQHKLYYYASTKLFHCYTECSDSFDIIELVCRSKHLVVSEAVKFINRVLGKNQWEPGFGFDEEINEED